MGRGRRADSPGLIADRCESELVAQAGLGVWVIPWAELDRRAGELPSLVDAAVDEIEAAVAAEPPPARPSRVEDELDWEAYEGLSEAAFERVLAVMRALVEEAREMLDELVAELMGRVLEGHRASLAPRPDA